MANKKVLTGLTLLWPVAHIIVFLLRFGQLPPPMVLEAVVFLPMGFLSGLLLLRLLDRSKTKVQKALIWSGYVAMSPIAFVFSLMGGLINTVVGPSLFGLIPLAVGMLLMYGVGALVSRFFVKSSTT